MMVMFPDEKIHKTKRGTLKNNVPLNKKIVAIKFEIFRTASPGIKSNNTNIFFITFHKI